MSYQPPKDTKKKAKSTPDKIYSMSLLANTLANLPNGHSNPLTLMGKYSAMGLGLSKMAQANQGDSVDPHDVVSAAGYMGEAVGESFHLKPPTPAPPTPAKMPPLTMMKKLLPMAPVMGAVADGSQALKYAGKKKPLETAMYGSLAAGNLAMLSKSLPPRMKAVLFGMGLAGQVAGGLLNKGKKGDNS